MADRVREVLLDPHRMAFWASLSTLAKEGIGELHQWGPRDGLPHPQVGPVHQHAVPTLALGLTGVTQIRGRQVLTLHAGDLLLLEPGCWHEHLPHREGSTSFGMGFLAGRCDVLFFDHQDTLWGATHEQPYRELVHGLMLAKRESDRLSRIDQVLAQVLKDRVTWVDWADPCVLRMAAHLWNHLHQHLDAEDLVEVSGTGRTTAFKLFKAFFGHSPRQELLLQRLDLAHHLLGRGFSVTEASERTGFTCRAELTRAYRRRFGTPPTTALRAG